MSTSSQNHTPNEEVNRIVAAYTEHNKVLRAWLAAYSIGVPGFIFSNDYLRCIIISNGIAREILKLFILAIAIQVFITFINKYINWINYNASDRKKQEYSFIENICDSISQFIFLDFIADIVLAP